MRTALVGILILGSALGSPAGAAAAAGQSMAPPPTPAALSLFQRDWVLMNWALKFFDADKDVALSPGEATQAAAAFRKIADTDGDGRVTPAEFRAARDIILARY